MTKRRSIISYDKLSIEQKKQILKEFPDGYINHLTTIKTPTGEVLDALIWDTDEIIYLVKIVKPKIKAKAISADNEDDFEDDLDKEDEIKDDDMDDEKDHDSDEEEDEYDKPDVDKDDDDDKD
jgi:hypothetical protein